MPVKYDITVVTDRGLEICEFEDDNGFPCSIGQSSATDLIADGGAAWLWLGRKNYRMHLSRAQVAGLVDALQRWLDTGSLHYDPRDRGV